MIDPNTPHPSPDTQPRPLRVALAHDWLVGYRGGEMVLDAIIALLHHDQHTITRIYTMFDLRAPLSPAIDALPRTVSQLNRYPPALRRWLLPRYPHAVRELAHQLQHDHTNEPIDLLISTSSAAIKSIQPPSGVPHICYCHSPARYLWSQTDSYTSRDLKGRLRSLGLKCFAPRLRAWDRATADHVDHYLANSTHTAREIERCYGRDSTVIYPPVRTDYFTPGPSIERKNHLLLVSALEPYKRIDLAIDAAIQANRKLTIVGSGSHDHALRKHANHSPLIQFIGRVSDESLRTHYRTAAAFLFPQIEDFGITAVEAQACGCPVIARAQGGALDSVIPNQTGVFFDDPTPIALAQAIEQCPSGAPTAQRCRQNALRFQASVFQEQMRRAMQECVAPTRA